MNKEIENRIHEFAEQMYQAGYEDGTKARDGERGSIYYGGYGDGLKDGYEKGLKHGQELRAEEVKCAEACGMKRAWEAARKICDIQNAAMIKELFGADANYVIYNFTPKEVIEKLEAWEKKQEGQKQPDKVDCKNTDCKNCINHNDCDYEDEKQEETEKNVYTVENRDKIVKAIAGLLAAYGDQIWDVAADMQKNP